jgi:uncharacterized membrane protein YbhN (UPF0104 family)
MIWSFDLLAELHLTTSSFDSLCMNDSTSNRIYLFETIRIVDSSSICWFRIESFYNHSIEMISFRFTDFRDRREINEFEDEYVILMKSNWSDNEKRRWLDQKKKLSWQTKISILKWISMNQKMKISR